MVPPSDLDRSNPVGDAPALPPPPPSSTNGTLTLAKTAGGPLATLRPAAPPGLSGTPTVLGLLKALRRRLVPAVAVGILVGVACACVMWYFSPPPRHTARSMLLIAPQNPHVFFQIENGNFGFDWYLRTQAALVKSRLVLNMALRDPNVAKLKSVKEQVEPVQWLEKMIQVDFNTGPGFMRISMSGEDPDELLAIVKAVTTVYMDEIVDKERLERIDRLDKFRKQHDTFEAKIKEREKAVRDLAEHLGSTDKLRDAKFTVVMNNYDLALRELADLHAYMRKLRVQMIAHRALEGNAWDEYAPSLLFAPQPGLGLNHALAALMLVEKPGLPFSRTEMAKSIISPDMVEEALKKDPRVRSLNQTLADLQKKMDYEERLGPAKKNSKDYKLYVGDRMKAQQDLETYMAKVRPKVIEELRDVVRQQSRIYLVKAQQEFATYQAMEKEQRSLVDLLDAQVRKFNLGVIRQDEIQDDLKHWRSFRERLAEEILKMEVEREAPTRVRKLEDPSVYYTDTTARNLLMSGATGLGGLALVLLGFAWWEFRTRRINSPEEVIQTLGLRLVGMLPDFTHRRRRLLGNKAVTDNHLQHIMAESVDMARTMVLHAAKTQGVRVVMVTSAMPGEGKTSTATHLAASLARAGRKTLLIDSDMRNPTAHRLFQLQRKPGFGDLLRKEVRLSSVIQPTALEGLSLLAAGRGNTHAIQALAQGGLTEIFEQVRQQFEFIVLDSCPVLPVADSMLLAEHVDAVIFAVLRDVSRLPKVYEAYQRLSALGVRILGAVVNGTREDTYYSGYPYLPPNDE